MSNPLIYADDFAQCTNANGPCETRMRCTSCGRPVCHLHYPLHRCDVQKTMTWRERVSAWLEKGLKPDHFGAEEARRARAWTRDLDDDKGRD